jgi:hypothetical protein
VIVRRRVLTFAVALFLILPLHSIDGRTAKQKDEPPLWRVRLKQLAHVSIPFRLCVDCLQIDYLENSTLAVTVLTTDMSVQAMKRGSSSGPYMHRTTLLDANSGQVRATHDWESATPDLRIMPTHDGKFIVDTYSEIALYSEGFVESQRLKYAEPGHLSSNSYRVAVSWDGRTVCVGSVRGNQLKVTLLNADSFSQISTWSATLPSPMWFVAANDNAVAVSANYEASIASTEHPWRTIFTGAKDPILSVLSVSFANNRVLLMTRGNRVIGVDPSGTQLFQTELSPKQFSLSARSSRSGRAFIVQKDDFLLAYLSQFVIPSAMGGVPEEIGVYDCQNGRAIFQRSLHETRERPLRKIAISPDANYVAVVSGAVGYRTDGVVEVFRIPHVDGVN